jgi:Flp pilus assembly protein TadG
MQSPRLRKRNCRHPKGVSAVELALTLPVMMIFLLGMIDAGQYVNVWNKVDIASREGARLAVRNTTLTSADVANAVNQYMSGAFPGVSPEALSAGLTTEVRDASNTDVTNLETVGTGDPLLVEVTINYDTVRWLKNNWIFSGRQISTTTRMRRE